MQAYTDKYKKIDPRCSLYCKINGQDKGRKKAARRINKQLANYNTENFS